MFDYSKSITILYDLEFYCDNININNIQFKDSEIQYKIFNKNYHQKKLPSLARLCARTLGKTLFEKENGKPRENNYNLTLKNNVDIEIITHKDFLIYTLKNQEIKNVKMKFPSLNKWREYFKIYEKETNETSELYKCYPYNNTVICDVCDKDVPFLKTLLTWSFTDKGVKYSHTLPENKIIIFNVFTPEKFIFKRTCKNCNNQY